jgi:hypothetical protein
LKPDHVVRHFDDLIPIEKQPVLIAKPLLKVQQILDEEFDTYQRRKLCAIKAQFQVIVSDLPPHSLGDLALEHGFRGSIGMNM